MKKTSLVCTQVALAMLLGALMTAPAAQAQPWPQDDTNAEKNDYLGWAVARGDFNGDGYEDLAVGVAQEDIGNTPIYDAGAVEVVYGTSSGLDPLKRQLLRQGSDGVEDAAEEEDFFGWSLAGGDFDGDGYDDLAIGVPWEDVSGQNHAGAVNVIFGSAGGLSATARADQFWHQDAAYVADVAESEDWFGWSLAAGDFNGDGRDDLAVGVPNQTFLGLTAAGTVHVLYGSPLDGLSATYVLNQLWNQNFSEDMVEPSDQFGWSLAAGDFSGDGFDDLAIGVPNESVVVGTGVNGAVNVIYGSGSGLSAIAVDDQFWHQDVANVEDVAESLDQFGWSLAAGDFNSDGFDDLAIGVPFEDVGKADSAGAVNVIYGSGKGLSATAVADQFWHQDVANVEDVAEYDDRFGWSLAVGDFNGDRRNDLAIGVRNEDLGKVVWAGAVNVIYGSSAGLHATATPDQFWHQDVADVEAAATGGDWFASSVAAGDFNGDGSDDLAIGVPYENLESDGGTIVDAGAANVIYGSSAGLDAVAIPDQFLTQVYVLPPLP